MPGWSKVLKISPVVACLSVTPAMAQRLAVDSGPPPVVLEHSDAQAALVQPLGDPTWVPPREVVRMLRSVGYDVLSRPRLRGPIFSVIVVSPRGEDGRIFVDARDGRLLRFVAGYALTGRTEEEIGLAYNPPGPPPVSQPRKPQPSPAKTASRTQTTGIAPSVNPQTGSSGPVARPTAAAPGTLAQPQTQASATRPADTRPADARPSLVIQPTREMPAVLGLE